MKLGYNTNGFAHHRLNDAIRILGDLGYQSVAITLDFNSLHPFTADPFPYLDEVRELLESYQMSCVIETGARYLLDRYRKHQPTLLDPDSSARSKRVGMLLRAIEYAHHLNANAVSFWSGTYSISEPADMTWQRLIDSCRWLSDHAARKDVRLAFEPEPGMLVATMDDFARLHGNVNHPHFGLTLDLGHLHCLGEGPIPAIIKRWSRALWNVHLEDMRQGVHDHLMFGEGEMEFTSIAAALHEVGYEGGVHVELSRHSYDAVNVAGAAYRFLVEHGFNTREEAALV
ncbi:MAG TPA: sugar phosphate isomerase/epimerase family protein [Gemmatales bacterium]|nr:sugar phosphate isomerase/epimerase family protein [Gemmatales bacterium]